MKNIKAETHYKKGDILVCIERFVLVTLEHIKIEFNKGDKVKLSEISECNNSVVLESNSSNKIYVSKNLIDNSFVLA